MARFLADENVPSDAVEMARAAGLDVAWIRDAMPGADDDTVLALSLPQGRILVTFDKGFGELAFRHGRGATCGVILLRPRLRSPDSVAQFMLAVLTQDLAWEGHFCVAREGLRRVPLPEARTP